MKIYKHKEPFTLTSGTVLQSMELGYTVIGNLLETKKLVWVFHALTANSDAALWWKGIVGENAVFNEQDYNIICVNIPGSCYGSSGPLSENPATMQPYFHDFPVFSVADIVAAFQLIQSHLNIKKIHIGIGGSMGGQHLLQWAVMDPDLFECIIPIAANARQSAYGLAIDTAQRLAIEADSSWAALHPNAGKNGMKAARAMALVQYRTYESFQKKNDSGKGDAASYQRYQAQKIADRFNAFSYYNLSLSRNTHDVEKELYKIKAQTLVIGFHSDMLFPVTEQEVLATQIKNASLVLLHSIYGHDAFLVEIELLSDTIKKFLKIKQ